ncbi:hypothetical protein AC1031_021937 [Aphanomyces cochlioides]|nr:hypothetical protein AC1031_021937 [Aphanomyces cochlioides]
MPPLLFIGASKNPRCFKDANVQDMDCQYMSAPKGWMTQSVFGHWVVGFNETMKLRCRHVLLLLDNASSHHYGSDLSNVTIKKLPPNTTAFLQPQDAGIIRRFKAKIEEMKILAMLRKFEELLASYDENDKENFHLKVNKLHEVTLVEAMQWAVSAWNQFDARSIANCRRHVNIFDEDMYELEDEFRQVNL